MKKLGLFLLKNNIHIMTLIFIGFAVWAGCNWADLSLVQKIVMGLYLCIIAHEYEEVNCGFMELLGGALGLDLTKPKPGATHIAQAIYITVIFVLAFLFPNQLWLTFAIIILSIFEGFVHTMGIFIFKLHKPSPGWYTAILMAAFAIWSIVKINATIDYPGIQWLWGALWFLFGFALLEAGVQRVFGNRLTDMPKLAKAMLKKRFGEK